MTKSSYRFWSFSESPPTSEFSKNFSYLLQTPRNKPLVQQNQRNAFSPILRTTTSPSIPKKSHCDPLEYVSTTNHRPCQYPPTEFSSYNENIVTKMLSYATLLYISTNYSFINPITSFFTQSPSETHEAPKP